MRQYKDMRDTRTFEQIREHYEVELELANRLRSASADERRRLYTDVYEELFDRVPHHPQLRNKQTPADRDRKVRQKLKLLSRFLAPNSTYMELGPGDCAMAAEVATRVHRVYAVDVSPSITAGIAMPDNFELLISDGSSVPVEPETVDVAFSDQLMEHLHPDDALQQLSEVYKALVPGGVYVCITPNRHSGPHDVSANFDAVAKGLHLREYDLRELVRLFTDVGFRRFKVYAGGKGIFIRLPVLLACAVEGFIERLPREARLTVPSRAFLGINLVAVKVKD